MDSNTILQALLSSDLYCSATLCEGSSQARAAALCVGLPVVTTACGEMCDVAADAPNVTLVPTASREDLYQALWSMVQRLLKGDVVVRATDIAFWREHFSVATEARSWQEAVADVIGAHRAERSVTQPR